MIASSSLSVFWCDDYKGEFMLADRRYCYPLTITDFTSRYLIAYCGLPDIDYPLHDKAATVTTCGRICFNNQKINLSQVFAGQTVGIKQNEDCIWLVSFMDYDLGYFDDETCRLELPVAQVLSSRPEGATRCGHTQIVCISRAIRSVPCAPAEGTLNMERHGAAVEAHVQAMILQAGQTAFTSVARPAWGNGDVLAGDESGYVCADRLDRDQDATAPAGSRLYLSSPAM